METHNIPSTRYQGSKFKLVSWIWDQIKHLRFRTVLDAFGGTGSVSYYLKKQGKAVTYNDYLKFNYLIGLALIANNGLQLSKKEVNWVLYRKPKYYYKDLIASTFQDIYFTDDENVWLDTVCQNIPLLEDKYKRAIAYFALFQACIIKRPYNLFHRKNLYMRTAKVSRSFGNKTAWDAPFENHFRFFVEEANNAVFDSGVFCNAFCYDALDVPGYYDIVYIDSPYINKVGVGVDYLNFYHFLEGMTVYPDWKYSIDLNKKHRPLNGYLSLWSDKFCVKNCFKRLFQRFAESIIVVSYRSDGYLSEQELTQLLSKYKSKIQIIHYGNYKYALSKNGDSKEYLIIAK